MKKLTPFLLIAATLIAFTSCKKEVGVTHDEGYAFIMGVNTAASTSGTAIDISVGTNRIAGLNFGDHSNYALLPAGNYPVNVEGTPDFTNVTLEKNKGYSVFAVDDPSGVKAVTVEDNLPGVATGISNIRFFQFSSDAPPMDIAIGGNVVFSNRNYNDQSNDPSLTGFITIIPGVYDIEVRDPSTQTVLYTFNSVVIDDAKTYSMIAKGSINGINDQGFAISLVAHN